MAISLSGIEQVVSTLDYRNLQSPKSLLIRTLQEYYRGPKSTDEIRAIDNDDLIDRMWHLSGDPAAIKAKRKNLSSIKSSVNSDLDAAWDRGENPEGISIGPLNTFVISNAAKNKILDSFTGSLGAGDGITLDNVAEALKIVADYLSKSPVDTEDSKMSVLKSIIGDLSRQFGAGASEFEVVEKGTSGPPSKVSAADEEIDESAEQAALPEEVLEDADIPDEEALEEVEIQEDAEAEALEEIETDEALDEDILEEAEETELEDEADEFEIIEETEPEVEFVDDPGEAIDEETLEDADILDEDVFEEVEIQEDAEVEALGEIETDAALDEDDLEEAEETELEDETDVVEVIDETESEAGVVDDPGEATDEDTLEDADIPAEDILEEVEIQEDAVDGALEEIETEEALDGDVSEEAEEIEEEADELLAIDEPLLEEVDSEAELIEDLEEDAVEEEFEEVEDGTEELEEVETDEILDEAVLDETMDELESEDLGEDMDELEEVETDDISEEREAEDAPPAAPELLNQIGLPMDQLSQDAFDFDDIQMDVEQKRLLAEAFDGYLGAMERYYNQYLLVPKGEYHVGSEEDSEQEVLPPQSAELPDFYMGKYPVTNALFEIFIERTGYRTTAEIKGYGYIYFGRFQKIMDPKTGYTRSVWNPAHTRKQVDGATWYQPLGPGSTLHMKRNHPVVQVSMKDARAFSAWTGKRLPTEMEWEAAARTRKGFVYPWGNEWRDGVCNLEENELSDTSPVDAFPGGGNEIGITDLLGNVMEWTSDTCDPKYTTEKVVKYHIVKGAAWITSGHPNLSSRDRVDGAFSSNIIGFRCLAD